MTYTEEQAKEIIPTLEALADRASEIKKEIDYLQDRLELHGDEELCKAYDAASKSAGTLTAISDAIKQSRADWVRDCITGWYRGLHWDMHAITPMPEEDITDPEYERVDYRGQDQWEIVMTTRTHGRELIVLYNCDGVDWPGVYSAEPIEQEQVS